MRRAAKEEWKSNLSGQQQSENGPPHGSVQLWNYPTQANRRLEWATREPAYFRISHDPTARKYGIASLSIEHRVNSLFAENKYFSEAPLPTDLHIKFLEEFEVDVLESMK